MRHEDRPPLPSPEAPDRPRPQDEETWSEAKRNQGAYRISSYCNVYFKCGMRIDHPFKVQKPVLPILQGTHANMNLKGSSRDKAGGKKDDEAPDHFTCAAYVAGLVKKQRSDTQRTIDRIEGGVPAAKGGRMGSKRNEDRPPLPSPEAPDRVRPQDEETWSEAKRNQGAYRISSYCNVYFKCGTRTDLPFKAQKPQFY